MATDVSSFKDAYKTAIRADFPQTAELTLGEQGIVFHRVPMDLRYGTNPHQPFAAYAPVAFPLSVGSLEMLKGGKAGLSLTNLQDMSQALSILRYFAQPATVAMKHLNPCGFKVLTNPDSEVPSSLYVDARRGDERSHFGSVVGFNYPVTAGIAEEIMKTFVEGVIAPDYSEKALEILRRNEGTKKLNNGVRVAKYDSVALAAVPKFVGDSVEGYLNLRNLVDGTITLETPYLTRIRRAEDFVTDPMIPNSDAAKNGGKDYVVQAKPTPKQLQDALTAWWLNVNVRSNGIVFVRDGMALAVGTGQQERIGAVEQAIAKAKQKGHSLEGSVMSSDAFFPSRDCIDAVAAEGVKAVVWPAGSMADSQVIEAANEHNIPLIASLERCFLHI
ncbi:MAG: IMP cyclohydrolase [Nanoarchaeota archaeon]|nr:IMP cyclohydrolase [Nanoarchaeota archaeon]